VTASADPNVVEFRGAIISDRQIAGPHLRTSQVPVTTFSHVRRRIAHQRNRLGKSSELKKQAWRTPLSLSSSRLRRALNARSTSCAAHSPLVDRSAPGIFPRASSAFWFASLGLLVFAAGTAPERPHVRPHRRSIADGNADSRRVRARPPWWWDYRIARGLRRGNFTEARAKLDDAISRIGGILATTRRRKNAQSFSRNGEKLFIGEPTSGDGLLLARFCLLADGEA